MYISRRGGCAMPGRCMEMRIDASTASQNENISQEMLWRAMENSFVDRACRKEEGAKQRSRSVSSLFLASDYDRRLV